MSKLPSDVSHHTSLELSRYILTKVQYKAQADATAVSLFPDQDVGTVSNASFGPADKDGLQRNLKPRHL